MSEVLRKLQREVFVLSLAEPLAQLPTIEGFELMARDDDDVEVAIGRGQDLNALFAALSARNIRVTSLRNKANRLEELFLRLVDRPPADEAAA
jgi:ABC-2 type transport system ATP-binding protein